MVYAGNYEKGDWILLAIDTSKTPDKFGKRHRVFEHVAKFVKYEKGNVVVQPSEGKEKMIPMYCTRPLPDTWKIPDDARGALPGGLLVW